ncbi:hypothetical protein ABBQ32_006706 [Trebouxia sp. C0010 RCD-2024]
MLGSQANETVLVEQPQAYITQKARVKRNRRTEWDYYVQFPGFPEDEGSWYSARAIKTSHPRGAELIHEFEHPNDSPELRLQPPAHQRQPAQLAGPQTQDVGPSQIGSHFLYEADGHSMYQHPYTQDHFASQLQQPGNLMLPTTNPTLPPHDVHGLQAVSAQSALNTAPQSDLQPPLHWPFERMQQSSHPRCLGLPSAQTQAAFTQPLHGLPMHSAQPQASMLRADPYMRVPGQHAQLDQGDKPTLLRDWGMNQQLQQPRQAAQGW